MSTGYIFLAEATVRYKDAEVKPILGKVIKRIYLDLERRYYDHLYLVEVHGGIIHALAAAQAERIVFTDLVVIRREDNKLFLEDSRGVQVRVRNFRLSEGTLQHYLSAPGEVLGVARARSEPRREHLVWNIARQRFEPRD